MADEPQTPAPEPAPTPQDEPEWARNLRQSIDSLPGKLRASITDDDRRSIAEHVHGLFERSGAFERPEEKPKEEAETPAESPEHDPDKDAPPERRTWAERMGFPRY